jgi:hypothetical protein
LPEFVDDFVLNASMFVTHHFTWLQDVSQNIRECVKVAEESTGIAATTMETLHDQGIQIRRSHLAAVRVEEELTTSEKLLGSLGGTFLSVLTFDR